METEKGQRPLRGVSDEELMQMFSLAMLGESVDDLAIVREEARVRDHWDDTDPKWAHMVEDCTEAMRGLDTAAGEGA